MVNIRPEHIDSSHESPTGCRFYADADHDPTPPSKSSLSDLVAFLTSSSALYSSSNKMMRPSLALLKPVTPLPLSSIPSHLLRLPQAAPARSPKPSSATTSPTIDRLLVSLKKSSQHRLVRTTGASEDGRSLWKNFTGTTTGAGAALEEEGGKAEMLKGLLPRNLRIEEYVPKRVEYEGVKAGHRDLVSSIFESAISFAFAGVRSLAWGCLIRLGLLLILCVTFHS